MATVQQMKATLDDLYRTPEKAELIGGRIVYLDGDWTQSRDESEAAFT